MFTLTPTSWELISYPLSYLFPRLFALSVSESNLNLSYLQVFFVWLIVFDWISTF